VLRHIASARHRVLRDEDADIDTAASPTTAAAAAAAAAVCNVDDDILLKAACSRRVARPPPAIGNVLFWMILNIANIVIMKNNL